MLRFFKTAIGEVIIRQTFEENGRPEENEYLIEIGKAFILCLYTGMGKRVFVMDTSKEVTPELMYLALDDYFSDFEELYKAVDKPIPGVCCVCGCTMENPCYHPEHGNCWWDDSSHTICSHCAETLVDGKKVFPSIKDDPETEHCINDHSKAFK